MLGKQLTLRVIPQLRYKPAKEVEKDDENHPTEGGVVRIVEDKRQHVSQTIREPYIDQEDHVQVFDRGAPGGDGDHRRDKHQRPQHHERGVSEGFSEEVGDGGGAGGSLTGEDLFFSTEGVNAHKDADRAQHLIRYIRQ